MAKTGPKGPSKLLHEAQKVPMVYGLCLDDGVIRYVGMTRNAYNRFRAYRSPRFNGNDPLLDWLNGNRGMVRFVVLSDDESRLLEDEKIWIKKLRNQCFNIMSGGSQSWRVNAKKPWSAGRGVLPPSSWVISRYAAAKRWSDWRDAILIRDSEIDGMTDAERCLYELGIAHEHRRLIPSRHQKWIDRCGADMQRCLQADGYSYG